MAQFPPQRPAKVGDDFVHEHYRLVVRRPGRGDGQVGNHDAIVPSIRPARQHGINTISSTTATLRRMGYKSTIRPQTKSDENQPLPRKAAQLDLEHDQHTMVPTLLFSPSPGGGPG
jgi:hypothetical protein